MCPLGGKLQVALLKDNTLTVSSPHFVISGSHIYDSTMVVPLVGSRYMLKMQRDVGLYSRMAESLETLPSVLTAQCVRLCYIMTFEAVYNGI